MNRQKVSTVTQAGAPLPKKLHFLFDAEHRFYEEPRRLVHVAQLKSFLRNFLIVASIFILLYGRDSRLLETRRLVLEASGYQLLVATKLSEVEQIVSIHLVHLIIICHTISLEECGRALGLTSSQQPAIRSLILISDTPSYPSAADEEVLYAMEGPAKLVLRVASLVGHPNSTTHSHTY
jgi:hypothetical protein